MEQLGSHRTDFHKNWRLSVIRNLSRKVKFNQNLRRITLTLHGEGKVKVKVTLVQPLRLCTGRTAHRGSRGIALLFLDHVTIWGWGVSVTPRPLFTRYPLYRRLGGPQGRSGQVRKISPPPGFDPRTVQPVASRYTNYVTRSTLHEDQYAYLISRSALFRVRNVSNKSCRENQTRISHL